MPIHRILLWYVSLWVHRYACIIYRINVFVVLPRRSTGKTSRLSFRFYTYLICSYVHMYCAQSSHSVRRYITNTTPNFHLLLWNIEVKNLYKIQIRLKRSIYSRVRIRFLKNQTCMLFCSAWKRRKRFCSRAMDYESRVDQEWVCDFVCWRRWKASRCIGWTVEVMWTIHNRLVADLCMLHLYK